MMTINGIRNALWCALAFAIVACASAPMQVSEVAAHRAVSNGDAGSREVHRGAAMVASNDLHTNSQRMVGTP
jgi:hypothetical protein